MKINFLKMSVVAIATLFAISCSKDEKTNSTETTNTSVNITNTMAKITVLTAAGVTKPNYVVMMFDQPFTTIATLPPILKQVTTDSNGLASFDMNTIVTNTTPKFYYFEAFVETTTGYTLKTIPRFKTELVKGNSLTTSLLVN